MKYVALVGSPNSGKTTLFNWLTGRRQRVVNYPGSTVDIAVGPVLANLTEDNFEVLDTPGTYSLFPKSQDEEVTLQTLFNPQFQISKVILVIDSTQLDRQWHLLRQLQESGFQVVVALTMSDLHVREKSMLSLERVRDLAGCPVVAIDGRLGGGVRELVGQVVSLPALSESPKHLTAWTVEKLQRVFHEGEGLAKSAIGQRLQVFDHSRKWDRILLHPLWGSLSFLLIMTALFSSIYWLAAPLMDIVDGFFGWSVEVLHNHWGQGLFINFLADGILAGTGAVLVFVPQILILFLGISFLEDSGYLARAATLIDRPLSKVGLNGKAFVPLLSGFACAVPAIMAARAIGSRKERWLATFIIPFMTCSARLPVYALLVGFLFPNDAFSAGLLMTCLYVGALVVGFVAAGVLNLLVRKQSSGFFLLELPLYRWPQPVVVIRNSFRRTRAYIEKTAPVILVLAVALWLLTTFPKYQLENETERLQSSYAAAVGQWMEPVFEPMGGDWRVGVGLVTAFAAREVFVSSMAVLFSITDTDDEDSLREGLLASMRKATFPDGRPVFTVASVSALLVFFMLALQCISTSAVAFREMGSASFAVAQLISMNILAYLAAIVTYSVMS